MAKSVRNLGTAGSSLSQVSKRQSSQLYEAYKGLSKIEKRSPSPLIYHKSVSISPRSS